MAGQQRSSVEYWRIGPAEDECRFSTHSNDAVPLVSLNTGYYIRACIFASLLKGAFTHCVSYLCVLDVVLACLFLLFTNKVLTYVYVYAT